MKCKFPINWILITEHQSVVWASVILNKARGLSELSHSLQFWGTTANGAPGWGGARAGFWASLPPFMGYWKGLLELI